MQSEPLNILDRINDTVIAFDKKGKISYVNKAFADVAGLGASNMIGKNIWELLPRLAESIVHKNINETIEKNQPMLFEWQGPYSNRIWETKVFPSDEGVIAVGRDITERKKAQEALEQTKDRLQKILNGIDDGITLVGLDGKVLDTNQASMKLLGLSYEEFVGTNVYDKIVDEDRQRAIDGSLEVLKKGKVVNEVRVNRKNKSYFWAEISVTALYDKTRKPTAFLGVTRDITERKHLQQKLEDYSTNLEKLVKERTSQLKEKERLAAIGQTAGMVGHDIRNPLQAIVSELFIVRKAMKETPIAVDNKETLESIDFIQEQVDYITKIVADLQDFARNTSPTKSIVDAKEVIMSALAVTRIPQNIDVQVIIEPNLKILIDVDYLKRIITNLSTNAIQAMPSGGKLTINVEQKATSVVITVKDTGAGIPDEVKDKLFTPLFTTKAKGQGFGLPVVKKFVEQLDGTISFESQVGKGTKFTIELPIKQ